MIKAVLKDKNLVVAVDEIDLRAQVVVADISVFAASGQGSNPFIKRHEGITD
jgi:hypothetical protein